MEPIFDALLRKMKFEKTKFSELENDVGMPSAEQVEEAVQKMELLEEVHADVVTKADEVNLAYGELTAVLTETFYPSNLEGSLAGWKLLARKSDVTESALYTEWEDYGEKEITRFLGERINQRITQGRSLTLNAKIQIGGQYGGTLRMVVVLVDELGIETQVALASTTTISGTITKTITATVQASVEGNGRRLGIKIYFNPGVPTTFRFYVGGVSGTVFSAAISDLLIVSKKVNECAESAINARDALLNLTAGQTTTLAPGNPAVVTVDKSNPALPKLNFAIPKGEKGLKGERGTDGEDGNQIYSGTLPPASGSYMDGEGNIYIQTTGDYQLYQFTPPAGWIPLFTLRGPQGKEGEQGIAGTDGFDGKSLHVIPSVPQTIPDEQKVGDAVIITDLMILTKVISISGNKAYTKFSPIKGDKGDPGIKGEQGLQGIQGATGAKGDKGDPGAAQGLLQTVKRFTVSRIPLENGIAWYYYDSPVNAELSPEMAPVSIQAGSLAIFSVTYNITASGSIVWPSTVTWEGGVVPGIQNETATFTFISHDGIHWHGNKSISIGG